MRNLLPHGQVAGDRSLFCPESKLRSFQHGLDGRQPLEQTPAVGDDHANDAAYDKGIPGW